MIGTGYVGLVTGTCFAEMSNNVICVDNDHNKIEKLTNGIIPIYEPGLEELVRQNIDSGTLKFTTDIKNAVESSNIAFIAVGTPMGEDGSADLKHVINVAESIGNYMTHDMIIVDKSTVPVGTADLVKKTIQKALDKRNIEIKFHIVSNPEFLKEGAAIEDSMRPERVVIGTDNADVMNIMKELYKPFTLDHDRFIAMDIRSAEMTKYAANAMLATKISFMNEISTICELVGADVNKVRIGIGSDSRIGYKFIYPGTGYGGSCFPKDVQALIKTSKNFGYEPSLLNAVEDVNNNQKFILVKKIMKRFNNNINGLKFAVWGLAFKPETDDMRDAPSITIIKELTKAGAIINAYDPKAVHEAKEYYLKGNELVNYHNSKYSALEAADALILITEWKEFRSPDFDEISKLMKNKIIFDGRNQYNKETMKSYNFEYYQVGVSDSK